MATSADKLIADLAERLQRPHHRAWWSARKIAEYVDVSPKYVTDVLSNRPGFPAPKRLPTNNGRGQLRWPSDQVIKWWDAQ